MRSAFRQLLCWLFLCWLLVFCSCLQAQISLQPVAIHLQSGKDFTLKIPAGYQISVAAEGLKRPRFFSRSPDGRLFVTDMYNRDDNRKGRILLLDKWDASAHRFLLVTTFMDSLHNPNQIAFLTYQGKHYLYVAETDKLTVYDYALGSISNRSVRKNIVARFPAYGLNYKYGGWHLTRSITIHNNKLYVSIGSSCNACMEKEQLRACIVEMNVNGSNKRLYATGLRNAVGMQWINNQLWVTNMGRDGIGPDKPQDVLTTITNGGFYGWPFYFQYKQTILADKQFKDSATTIPKPQTPGWCGFAAHTAPLGLCHFTGFTDPVLNNKILVALHGSTTVSRQRGNEIVMITGTDKYTPVVTGFLAGKTEAQRFGRPCDVFQWDNRSFFISDDKNGVIYYVWKD